MTLNLKGQDIKRFLTALTEMERKSKVETVLCGLRAPCLIYSATIFPCQHFFQQDHTGPNNENLKTLKEFKL